MSEIILSGENLIKSFPVKRSPILGRTLRRFSAVRGISLSLHQGECLGIVGESGSGKSTTAELLGDLQQPDSGIVSFQGKNIRDLSPSEYQSFRRNVQFVFQDPKGSMNPHASIEGILTEPLISLKLEANPEKRAEMAREVCAAVGLEPSVLKKHPGELSGGQAQRVAIGRAIIGRPQVIICDEAVSALDVSIQAQILNLLKKLQREFGISYLFISHDISVINFIADRVIVMKEGSIVEEGKCSEVLTEPKDSYTKQLLEAVF